MFPPSVSLSLPPWFWGYFTPTDKITLSLHLSRHHQPPVPHPNLAATIASATSPTARRHPHFRLQPLPSSSPRLPPSPLPLLPPCLRLAAFFPWALFCQFLPLLSLVSCFQRTSSIQPVFVTGISFKDASSHLCKGVCPYFRPSVHPSACLYVCPSLSNKKKPQKTSIQARQIIVVTYRSILDASYRPSGLAVLWSIAEWTELEIHEGNKRGFLRDSYMGDSWGLSRNSNGQTVDKMSKRWRPSRKGKSTSFASTFA